MTPERMTPVDRIAKADEAIDKAWHYLYGDGADPVVGQGFATLAVAHATIAQAQMLGLRRI